MAVKKICKLQSRVTPRTEPSWWPHLRQLLGWSGVGNSTGDKNDRMDCKDAANWQYLADVRWLQRDGKAELVPVLVKYLISIEKHFFRSCRAPDRLTPLLQQPSHLH